MIPTSSLDWLSTHVLWLVSPSPAPFLARPLGDLRWRRRRRAVDGREADRERAARKFPHQDRRRAGTEVTSREREMGSKRGKEAFLQRSFSARNLARDDSFRTCINEVSTAERPILHAAVTYNSTSLLFPILHFSPRIHVSLEGGAREEAGPRTRPAFRGKRPKGKKEKSYAVLGRQGGKGGSRGGGNPCKDTNCRSGPNA